MFADKHIPEPSNSARRLCRPHRRASRAAAIGFQGHDAPRPQARASAGAVGRGTAAMAGREAHGSRNRGGRRQEKTLTGKELEDWKYQRYMQDYLACVQSVDDNVGRVLDWLDANGLRENTVVIYTSDQGFFLGEHGLFDKRFMYEESLRMPFLVRWPAAIKPGSTSDAIGINCDFAPTFLDLAGQPAPPDMQGRSFVPHVERQQTARIGATRCTTATTTTRATTTRARITESAPTRTS